VQVLDGIYHPRIEYPPAPSAPARTKDVVVQAPVG
jgi:hypothetical protein